MEETKIYNSKDIKDANIIAITKEVASLLEERGYDPINQIVGYLMSGDPGYISNYKEARRKLTKLDRTKVLEVIIREFIK